MKKTHTPNEQADEDSHQAWVRTVTEQWKPHEWEKMRKKLEKLSLAELKAITDAVGISFTIGNDNICDKEEFILVLDEADKTELYRAYNQIARRR